VRNLVELAGDLDLAEPLIAAFAGGVVASCVGPVCAGAAHEVGITAPVSPDIGRLGLLVRSLSDHLSLRRRTFVVDGQEVVVQGATVVIAGERMALAPRERAVFALLAARPGAVVPTATLLAKVWGSTQTDASVLQVTVGRLRKRLGPAAPVIAAVPGRGYRLAV